MTTPPSNSIADMVVPYILLHFHSGNKTGAVSFDRENVKKKIYFRAGNVIDASSTAEEDGLGEALLKAGKITPAQRQASTELVQKTKKQLGTILLDLGFLGPQDLLEGTRLQIRQIVSSLIAWRDGKYFFEEGAAPSAGCLPLFINTIDLIIEAARLLDWRIVRRSLPPLKTVLNPAPLPAIFRENHFSTDQKAVLALIDGTHSMEEICVVSGQGDFNTLNAIYLFLSLHLAVPGKVKSDETHTTIHVTSRKEDHLKTDTPKDDAHLTERELIKKAFEELDGRNFYQVMGVQESATAQEIKKAYFKLAKLYHPDRHHDQEGREMKPMLEKLFTTLNDAYNVLSAQAKRDKYDLSRIKGVKKVEFEEDKTDRTGTAVAQFNKGLKEFKAGNFWGALDAFRWANRLDSQNAKYEYYQGLALSKMPRRDHEAEEAFKKAIELEPANPDYYIELGNFYLKVGLKARALSTFKDALNWDPDSEKARQGITAAEK